MMYFPTFRTLLLLCLIFPLLGSVLIGVISVGKDRSEKVYSRIIRVCMIGYLISSLGLILHWILFSFTPMRCNLGSPYHSADYKFSLSFYFDTISALFLGTSALISNVIVNYSYRYLHKDSDYSRFFFVILSMIFGMNLIVLSGTFELLFAGWEIVGFSSFLLIAFYWKRKQAVLNALRTYSIYRFCDLGLLLGAWLAQYIWHQGDIFYRLNTAEAKLQFSLIPPAEQWAMCGLLLIALIGKSAQFPFLTWLARAMEGPTPSSAIFYGSLSVHLGVFLLLRTYIIWHHTAGFPWVIGAVGIITALMGTLFGRTQTNIKGQIGYAAVSQVGIILVELALGFRKLALLHYFGNACLRCFQLLISPSILGQQLQIHNTLRGKKFSPFWNLEKLVPHSVSSTLYMYSVNEGFLDMAFQRWVIKPILRFSSWICEFEIKLRCLVPTLAGIISILMLAGFSWAALENHSRQHAFFSDILSLLAIILSLASVGESSSADKVLNRVILSNFSVALAIALVKPNTIQDELCYLWGVLVSWIVAKSALHYIREKKDLLPISSFSGALQDFPNAGNIFLLGISGLLGFPYSVSFIGEDMILHHAIDVSGLSALIFSLTFVINGISIMKMYSYLFFGKRELKTNTFNLDFKPSRTFFNISFFFAGNILPIILRKLS